MEQRPGRVKLIVDGMTGLGKTSLVELLSRELSLSPFEELFRDRYDILRKFYQDRRRWAFPMQVMFLNNRYCQYREASLIGSVIMDRSIYSDPIFAEMYREQRYMSEEEFGIYNDLWKTYVAEITPPGLMIYLQAEFQQALSRIRSRGRDDELKVEEDYWYRLWETYEGHYAAFQACPLLKLELTGLDFVHSSADRRQVIEQVRHALAMAEEKTQSA